MKYLRKFNESKESGYILDEDDMRTVKDIFMEIEDEFDFEITTSSGILENCEYRISWVYDEVSDDFSDVYLSKEKRRSFGISMFGRVDNNSNIDINEFIKFVENLIQRINSIYEPYSCRCVGGFFNTKAHNADSTYFSYQLK
jgi:hypothetical protein